MRSSLVGRADSGDQAPRGSGLRRRSGMIMAVILVAGCGSPAPATIPPVTSTPTAVVATPPPSAVAATAMPDPRDLPLIEIPAGYRAIETVEFGVGMVLGDLMIAWNMDTGELYRWTGSAHDPLDTLSPGTPGSFAPDVQSASPGTGGIWVNLPSRNAVALLDPRTGKTLRLVEILGHPYDMVEVGNDLWIADFGWSEVTRYDLASDAVVATIPVSAPTDIAFGEGAIWVPMHIGRSTEAEPIDGPGGHVVRIDPSTNAATERVPVGHRPYYLAIGFGSVWTGNATSATVSRVDVETNEATTIPVGEDGAFDIEVVGDSVWAITGPQWPPERQCDPATSFFVRIDPATNAVRERVAFPCAGAITPAGDGFWVSGRGEDGELSVLFQPVS